MSDGVRFRFAWPETMDSGNSETYGLCCLSEVFNAIRGQIERAYLGLPWPEGLDKVSVLTEVVGGKGDVAGAAKAMAILQREMPHLEFYWKLTGDDEEDPHAFFPLFLDPTKVHVVEEKLPPAALNLLGPVRFSLVPSEVNDHLEEPKVGAYFSFVECGLQEEKEFAISAKAYKWVTRQTKYSKKLHAKLFPISSHTSRNPLTMNLEEGSGIFLDRERMDAPLSTPYSCLSYIDKMEDSCLKETILREENISFNSGYAHLGFMWQRFIFACALHEKEKNVVIVLNRTGAVDNFSPATFWKKITSLKFMRGIFEMGYNEIAYHDLKGDYEAKSDAKEGRRLVVITRESFSPTDMKWMQLASDRLLTTGDNTFAEAMAARCKLHIYEPFKDEFIPAQQTNAKNIDERLFDFVAISGKMGLLNKGEQEAFKKLLNDPDLSDLTLRYCLHIQENYNFEPYFLASVKRSLWLNQKPELALIEMDALGEEFQEKVITHLSVCDASTHEVTFNSLTHLTGHLIDKI